MNKISNEVLLFLANILEQHKDLDYVSDGNNGGLDYHFKDGSKLNLKVEL